MISKAMATAPASVTHAPKVMPNSPSWGPAISTSPAKASVTPTRFMADGRRRITSHCSSGTIGTYSPVMKAD